MLSLGKIRACLPAAWRSDVPKQIITAHGKPEWHQGVWWMNILPRSREEYLWEVRNVLQWKLPTQCIKFTTKWPSRALKSHAGKEMTVEQSSQDISGYGPWWGCVATLSLGRAKEDYIGWWLKIPLAASLPFLAASIHPNQDVWCAGLLLSLQ